MKNDLGLLRILGRKIFNVDINIWREELTITFEDESQLCLIGNEIFESFTLNINNIEVTV